MEAGAFLNRDKNKRCDRLKSGSDGGLPRLRCHDRGRRTLDQRRDLCRCAARSRQEVEILEAGQDKQEIDSVTQSPIAVLPTR